MMQCSIKQTSFPHERRSMPANTSARPIGGPNIGLALAGGNALGAYEAGAYEALHERGYRPTKVSGASAGAINGALIAGNAPEQRVEKLRQFWTQAAQRSDFGFAPWSGKPRETYNTLHALQTLLIGRPGLFSPRIPGLMSIFPGMPRDVALFDTKPLAGTLERLVDFELLNRAELPLTIGTVDMESGEPVYFDNREERLEPAHFLASTAFAPAFPPVEIGGRYLGDPGLFSNLPLDAFLEPPLADDLLLFAVDLFEPHGARPTSLDAVVERAQDIVFGNQSQRTLDARTREHALRRVIRDLGEHLSPELRGRAEVEALTQEGGAAMLTIVYVPYRAGPHELSAKTFDFSRASIDERWAAGLRDMNAAIDGLEQGQPTKTGPGFSLYDVRKMLAP